MKTKFYAVLASVVLIAQAQAGGNHGGGGGGFAAPAVHARAAAPSFNGAPMRSFGSGGMINSGQRFSSPALSPALRQPYISPNRSAYVGARQVTPRNLNRGEHNTRFSNGGNRAITNAERTGNGAGQVHGGNNLPTNWRNRVVAQHSANWHRNWERNRDHWWHGHHCRFINDSWFVFDFGFYPWWPYWGYPYDYYAYNYYPSGYYPYSYYPYSYDSYGYGSENYDQGGYLDQYTGSIVAAVQERLAQQGYYHGEIDGVFGPEMRRAIVRYQRQRGLRVTGRLTADVLQDLGLRRS
jgi:Putative peptidoglycan binding domain